MKAGTIDIVQRNPPKTRSIAADIVPTPGAMLFQQISPFVRKARKTRTPGRNLKIGAGRQVRLNPDAKTQTRYNPSARHVKELVGFIQTGGERIRFPQAA